MYKTKSLILTGLLFLINVAVIKASVMAIDYGSEWYKVSLITPKIPLELVLNEESQRKTRSIISIVDDIRMFSNDAVSKFTKNPSQTFDFLKLLVGKKINDEEVKFYKSIFNIDIIEDQNRNSILIKSDDQTYTVEELISYQLSKAKLIAENMSGKSVDKGVLTVPRFFNQYERLSIVNAAEIAGIKVISLMNEDTAAAVNYAMTRNFESQPKYYIFFDMGASSTTITLYSIKSVNNPNEKSKKSPEIEIINYNYDKTLGGLAFDRELQLLIVEKIKEITKAENIENDAKVMAKILIKARKAKEILSVNSDTTVNFDNLINDQDITIKITKEEFEKASKILLKRLNVVVDKFFKSISIPKDFIDSFILVGGSTRVPMVQNILKKYIGDNKLANYVNSDEAIVMGSGFQAASLSQEFKVRTIYIKDIHSSSNISYEYKLEDGKLVSGKLFNEKDPLSKEVIINLKTKKDFDIAVNYDTANRKQLIFKAKISNINEVIEANAIKEKKEPKVTLKFSLANSDIVFISHASVKAKIPINHRESLIEKFLKLIKKPHWYKNRTVGKYKPEDLPANTPKNFDVIKKQLPLNQVINEYDIKPLTGTIKKAAIDRKKAMDNKDKDRIEIDIQKNDLESLIYKGREMLSEQEELEDKENIMLSAEEIKEYKKQLGELFEKLFEEGQIAKISLEDIKEKITNVSKIVNLAKERKNNIKSREKSVKQFKSFIKETRNFYEAMINIADSKESREKEKESKQEPSITEVGEIDDEDEFSEVVDKFDDSPEVEKVTNIESEPITIKDPEIGNLERNLGEKVKKLCNDAEQWLNDVMQKQSLLKYWDNPAFTSNDVEKKILEIYNDLTTTLEKIKQKQADVLKDKEEIKDNAKNTEAKTNFGTEKVEEGKNEQKQPIMDTNTSKDEDNTIVNEEINSNEKKSTPETEDNNKPKVKNDEL